MAVVTGLAIAAAGTAASIGMNLSAAAKQSKAQSAAEQAAAEATKKAETEYQREFAGGVQLPMEAYQQAGREGTAQQMQALQSLQEADSRSLAAGVGKVQAAATDAQSAITDKMREDLFSLESAQMEEKMKNRDAIAKMNQERAMGAQTAAANAEAAKMNAYASIGSSISGLASTALQSAPLYGKTGGTADISKGFTVGDTAGMGSTINPAQQSPIGERFGAPQQSPIGNRFAPSVPTYGIFEQYPGITAPKKPLSNIQQQFGAIADKQYDYYNQ